MPHLATLQTISCDELVTATGGQWQPRLPQPGSPGSGPMTLFSLLELYKRGEADWIQDESFGPIRIEPRAGAEREPGARPPRVAVVAS